MPVRLSELLERIRPAGTPGAPSEGDRQGEELDRVHETEEIAAIIRSFEDEADAVVAEATDHAVQLRQDAERKARGIRSGVPERIAAAEAAAAAAHAVRDEAERSSVGARTEAEVARLQAKAVTLIPSLRDAAIETVWSVVPTEPRSKSVQ